MLNTFAFALKWNRSCGSNSIFLHAFKKGGGKQADLNDFEIFDFRWKRWSTVLRGGQMLWAGWSASPGQVEAPYTTHAGGMSSAALSKVTHLEDGGKAQQCTWQVQRHLRSTGDSVQMRNYRFLHPPCLPVFAVKLPGRESRAKEPFFHCMQQIVDEVVGTLLPVLTEKPFALFGHRYNHMSNVRLSQ